MVILPPHIRIWVHDCISEFRRNRNGIILEGFPFSTNFEMTEFTKESRGKLLRDEVRVKISITHFIAASYEFVGTLHSQEANIIYGSKILKSHQHHQKSSWRYVLTSVRLYGYVFLFFRKALPTLKLTFKKLYKTWCKHQTSHVFLGFLKKVMVIHQSNSLQAKKTLGCLSLNVISRYLISTNRKSIWSTKSLNLEKNPQDHHIYLLFFS